MIKSLLIAVFGEAEEREVSGHPMLDGMDALKRVASQGPHSILALKGLKMVPRFSPDYRNTKCCNGQTHCSAWCFLAGDHYLPSPRPSGG